MGARIRVLHHNVRNWGDSRHSLCNSFREVDPDVITINSHGSGGNLRIWGYSVVAKGAAELHDGWAIAVRRNLRFRVLDLSEDGILAVQLQTEDGPLVIATYYRPFRRDELPMVDMLGLANRAEPVYLLADLNARHSLFGHADTNGAGRMVADLIRRGKFERLGPEFPTFRGARGRAGTPDIVLGNGRIYRHHRIWDGGPTVSDHTMVVLDLAVGPISVPIRERYCMKRADWDRFGRELDNLEWKELENDCIMEDVDESVEELQTRIRGAKDTCVPKIRNRALPGPPLTDEVKLARFRLKNAVQRYDMGQIEFARVCELQRELREEARVAYLRTWNEEIGKLKDERKECPSTFWRKIRRMKGDGSRASMTGIRDEQGVLLTSADDVCETFTRKLVRTFRISPEENEMFDDENEERVVAFLEENRQRIFPRIRADIDALPNLGTGARFGMADLVRAIRSFRERAPGESGITAALLKNLPDSVLAVVLRLFNACLSLGYFPDGLKVSVVKMIPKKPNARSVNDFRPISLLEILGKVLERMINERLMVHMELNELYYDYQFGYRKGKGTTMAIAVTYEWLARSLAERRQTYVVFRDVSKAFDKVWHLGLKFKILGLGLHENLERMLCDYLEDRRAYIRLRGWRQGS